ncbi:hypothetical protein RS130_11645 [Paraglaciecola aquimarina]|uniref:DUF3157 family protein n=1 Tax=Paraglaciecola aquimarina TaxID=1235557 RepID=A0ABU3SWV9_9ALTE|nr:hypothetical protein [Paraglaciecola aquimarina]MDU0354502.1 hypothetical protein [Paraglaciecola aquimarina]
MKLLISVVLCLAALSVSASQKAMTEEGEVVILHDDGTWSYESSHAASDTEIPLNPAIFSKDSRASFELKSTKTNSVFAIDPKKMEIQKERKWP